ncbi:MAG: carbohydrate ABC transporter permease [Spirochaetes bacterium]|nr:MAG: carbohydrate ABC transporter permease [Spirochaetota bacterium]
MATISYWKIRKKLSVSIKYLLLFLVLIFFLFPVYWLILTSVKYPGDINSNPIVWITTRLTVDNFKLLFGYKGAVWGEKGYVGRSYMQSIAPFLINSIGIGTISTLIAMILGANFAYGIVRFNFGRQNLYTWLLSLRMIPPVVISIPMFLIFNTFRMLNTWTSLIIAYLLTNIPFVTLMLIGFFKDIPSDIPDAARIDGYTQVGAFYKVVLPLILPGLVAVFIISFLFNWNELLIAATLTTSDASQTFPVFTANFVQVERGTAWGIAAAGGVVGILPVVLLSSYIQKYMLRGLSMGAIR